MQTHITKSKGEHEGKRAMWSSKRESHKHAQMTHTHMHAHMFTSERAGHSTKRRRGEQDSYNEGKAYLQACRIAKARIFDDEDQNLASCVHAFVCVCVCGCVCKCVCECLCVCSSSFTFILACVCV